MADKNIHPNVIHVPSDIATHYFKEIYSPLVGIITILSYTYLIHAVYRFRGKHKETPTAMQIVII